MKNFDFDFDLVEMFKSYCEVLQKENDDWYGHADYLIYSLPEDIRRLFHYVVDTYVDDFKDLTR